MNLLGSMMLGAPTFHDRTGYFPDRDIDSEFASLNAGLEENRRKLGEEAYQNLVEVSTRMRSHFENGLKGSEQEVSRGRRCIEEMEDILRSVGRRKR
jgi:hypothetical protein